MATAKVLTLAQLAAKLKVSSERVRQLREEVAKDKRRKVGMLAGNTIVLTDEEVEWIVSYYNDPEKVRPYTRKPRETAAN